MTRISKKKAQQTCTIPSISGVQASTANNGIRDTLGELTPSPTFAEDCDRGWVRVPRMWAEYGAIVTEARGWSTPEHLRAICRQHGVFFSQASLRKRCYELFALGVIKGHFELSPNGDLNAWYILMEPPEGLPDDYGLRPEPYRKPEQVGDEPVV